MGTHPIFESDFDCLTDFNPLVKNMARKQAPRTTERKETRQEKRDAKREWAENRDSVQTVVVPALVALAFIVLLIIFFGTRYEDQQITFTLKKPILSNLTHHSTM